MGLCELLRTTPTCISVCASFLTPDTRVIMVHKLRSPSFRNSSTGFHKHRTYSLFFYNLFVASRRRGEGRSLVYSGQVYLERTRTTWFNLTTYTWVWAAWTRSTSTRYRTTTAAMAVSTLLILRTPPPLSTRKWTGLLRLVPQEDSCMMALLTFKMKISGSGKAFVDNTSPISSLLSVVRWRRRTPQTRVAPRCTRSVVRTLTPPWRLASTSPGVLNHFNQCTFYVS